MFITTKLGTEWTTNVICASKNNWMLLLMYNALNQILIRTVIGDKMLYILLLISNENIRNKPVVEVSSGSSQTKLI